MFFKKNSNEKENEYPTIEDAIEAIISQINPKTLKQLSKTKNGEKVTFAKQLLLRYINHYSTSNIEQIKKDALVILSLCKTNNISVEDFKSFFQKNKPKKPLTVFCK